MQFIHSLLDTLIHTAGRRLSRLASPRAHRAWSGRSVVLALSLSAAACGSDTGTPVSAGRELDSLTRRSDGVAPSACGRMLPGEEIHLGESVRSCNGVTTLILQPEQNLVLYDSAGASWSAPNTLYRGTAVVRMQEDGNLVAYDSVMGPLWSTGTANHPHAWLSVQDDCNLVIYAGPYPQQGAALWTTNTPCRAPRPAPGRMLPGERLSRTVSVSSVTGNVSLTVQPEQNVVLYNKNVALWSAPNTLNRGTSMLVMQGDGNLVAYNGSGGALWASGTAGHPGAWLAIQDDCNLVIYRGPHPQTNGALWATNTATSNCVPSGSGGALRGDDYPYRSDPAVFDRYGCSADPWAFCKRNCTSFVAWRLRQVNNVPFTNTYRTTTADRWGNASNWGPLALRLGILMDGNPRVGDVAWFSSGHVAWVAAVNPNGTVLIEEYNADWRGNYGSRTIPVSNVSGFIHIT